MYIHTYIQTDIHTTQKHTEMTENTTTSLGGEKFVGGMFWGTVWVKIFRNGECLGKSGGLYRGFRRIFPGNNIRIPCRITWL